MAKNGGKREGAGRKAGIPNKASGYIRELAGEHAEVAIQTLLEIMQASETPAAARVSAAKELIERGYGKTGNYVDLELEKPLSELPPEEAMGMIADKVADGTVSTEEGQRLVLLIEAKLKSVDYAELMKRLDQLEASI